MQLSYISRAAVLRWSSNGRRAATQSRAPPVITYPRRQSRATVAQAMVPAGAVRGGAVQRARRHLRDRGQRVRALPRATTGRRLGGELID